jgi:hypothetical protein
MAAEALILYKVTGLAGISLKQKWRLYHVLG